MVRIHPIVCIGLAAIVRLSAAQTIDIRGVVTDSTTGERLPSVNVTLVGTARGAVTNTNGFYLIPAVPAGRHEIAASAVGYGRIVKPVIVRGGQPMTVDFMLSPKPVEASEVVVEGENIQRLEQSSPSVHVLSRRELATIPEAAQSDVIRAIQILPGIVSTSDVNSKFYVRGGAGDENLILLDGMKIYNPFHAFGIFSIFDPDVIKSTEVYTGAFPAGFGDRLSSVLNLTTRSGNTSTVSGGANINFISTKLHLEGPLVERENSWIISGRKSLFDNTYRYFLKNPVPISFYDVFAKATLGGATGQNGFRGFLSGDDVKSANPDEPDYSWRNQAFAASLSGLVADRLYVNAVVYTNRFIVNRDTKQSKLIFPARSEVQENGIRGEMTIYTESRNLFYTGFDVDFLTFDNNVTQRSGLTQDLSNTGGEAWLWFRYEGTLGRLKTTSGIHTDVASLFSRGPSLGAIEPRISVSYEFENRWRIKASYGVFDQNVITINNEDDIISLFEAWIFIPEYLKPEEAHHYVLGVEGNIWPSLSLDLQGYYKNYTSLVLYNRAKLYPSDPDYINGTGKAYGAEALVRFASRPLDVYVAYTLGWVTVNHNGLSYPPRYDRRHTVNALSVVHLFDDLDISVRWEFGSGYPFTQTVGYYDRLTLLDIGREPSYTQTGEVYSLLGAKNARRLPVYHRLDASITYRFTIAAIHGTAGASVMNVYDRKNILFYDRKTGQRIDMVPFFPSASLTLEF